MKWSRAVHHLTELVGRVAELPAAFSPFRVVELWAFGGLLGAPRDLEAIDVAVVVDLPEVAWQTEPVGAEHWANATRASRNPVVLLWRSDTAPVWNHYIVAPVRVWSAVDGVDEPALAALAEGAGARAGLAAPSDSELRARLDTELTVSLNALRRASTAYGERRWGPGKLTPLSDALWRSSTGYLELLDARAACGP